VSQLATTDQLVLVQATFWQLGARSWRTLVVDAAPVDADNGFVAGAGSWRQGFGGMLNPGGLNHASTAWGLEGELMMVGGRQRPC